MDSTTESSLLSKLQSPDLSNTHHLFSAYLSPFSALLQNPTKKPQTKKPTTSKTLTDPRSLAKQFLPFLNRTLSLLPKRLSETPKLDPQFAVELFDIYKLCLNCLDAVSSQLSCKPYSVQIQRVRLIHCFESWGQYEDAESEGLSVLQSLRAIEKNGNLGNKYVRGLGKDNLDNEFAYLVVEIVVTLVKCVSMNQSKEENDYRRVLVMVSEIAPWFSVVDANAYEKLHRVLVSYMSKCALLLVGDLMHFDKKLVCTFCLATFAELAKSSSKDQMHKFARRICYSLFSQQDNQFSIIDILACVLDSMAGECKVGTETTLMEFLEVVYYCANKCRTTTANIYLTVAEHLQKIADDFCLVCLSPTDLIMSLYAIGLFINGFCGQLRLHGSATPRTAKDLPVFEFLLDNEHRLQNLTGVLGSLKHHYNSSPEGSNLPYRAESKNSVYQMLSRTESNYKSSTSTQNGKPDILCYRSALQFLCQPLAESVNSERKEILTEIEDVSLGKKLYSIQDAFHQFLDVFLLCQSASEKERDTYDDNNKTVQCSHGCFYFVIQDKAKDQGEHDFSQVCHFIRLDSVSWAKISFCLSSQCWCCFVQE